MGACVPCLDGKKRKGYEHRDVADSPKTSFFRKKLSQCHGYSGKNTQLLDTCITAEQLQSGLALNDFTIR